MHTNGPWRSVGFATYGDDEHLVSHTGVVGDHRPAEEREANAQLIAASPSYYEAVEQMLSAEDEGGDRWWKGWEMLKAAHKQAKGE